MAPKGKETLILKIPFTNNSDLDSVLFKLESKQCFIFQNSHTRDQVEDTHQIYEICDRFEISSWKQVMNTLF